jgi:hypothetical protein
MPPMRNPGPVAPRVLDPVLALVERIDRRLRRIRPIRPGGLLGLERRRYRGPERPLGGGARLRHGDRVVIVHIDNAAVRRIASDGWQTTGLRAALDDMHALAALHARLPAGKRPVAYGGVTILASLTRRIGFEVFERARTPRVRLEDWYLRSLLARWSRRGRARLWQGHGPMRTRDVWMSAAELLRRYGAPVGAPSPEEPSDPPPE